MKLESGPAAYDRNYYLIFFVLCLCLGAYFFYDYKVGYLKKNHSVAVSSLAAVIGADHIPDPLPMHPTKPEFQQLIQSKPTKTSQVYEKLGQPTASIPGDEGTTVDYFVSAYGMVAVVSIDGVIAPNTLGAGSWTTWFKSKEEIQLQLYCALICLAVSLYVLTRVFRAARLRAIIDDESLTYGGRRIPFENMLRLCDYSKKGWVDLYYKLGSREFKLRIDNQKIRKFDEIIDALCAAKGFDDPRKATEQSEDTQA